MHVTVRLAKSRPLRHAPHVNEERQLRQGKPAGVSVVITCFNLAAFIGEAINSVLRQDFSGETEIIVVDDCSTDASADVISRFDGVRSLRQPENGGVLLAMLAGIDAASHDIVAFLDGDDVWEPHKLTSVIDCFARDGRTAFVTHDLVEIDETGKPIDRPTRPRQVLTAALPDDRFALIKNGILELGDFIWLGSAMSIRCSAAKVKEFAQLARTWPERRDIYQDWPLAFWIASLDDVEMGYVPKVLFGYRLHGLNHSGDAGTAAKALRNFKRTRNTLAAMRDIAVRHRLPASVFSVLDRRLGFYDYLLDLYSARRGKALGGWVRNLGYTRRQGIWSKEAMRFGLIMLVGPERFSRHAKRRSILRELPAS